MDKDLLAHKLYVERVTALMGDNLIDYQILDQMWEAKASPSDAAKAMLMQQQGDSNFECPAWLNRYLTRK
ncbi:MULTISPECIES: hypothetical protein [Vibrio]|uniref:Uncharacterized protein n=2 Tax=Vibrio TaxID=662 RepID=A0A7X4LK71_9VIBR|nr:MULTISPECIES: hypothetical protein [Vibrio]MBF8999908.1 hypothetical protein [Vibrio nitrifigilis]MZI93478.1 hypothetical protein [Vibrio eleionomae]